MSYIEKRKEYAENIKQFLNFLINSKKNMNKFLAIQGFRQSINGVYQSLMDILNTDFESQKFMDNILIKKIGDYWVANYYSHIELTEENYILTYDMLSILLKDDVSEIYYINTKCDLNYENIVQFINKHYPALHVTIKDIETYFTDATYVLPNCNNPWIHSEINMEIVASEYKNYTNTITKYFLDGDEAKMDTIDNFADVFRVDDIDSINNLVNEVNHNLVKK